jgi:alpha-tubulin suppressor-like RCC1 family protein
VKIFRCAPIGQMLMVAALLGGCGARSSLSTPPPEKDAGDPCDGITCATPPAPGCRSETTLRTFSAPGVCVDGACSYSPIDTECPAGCADGMCTPSKGKVMVSAGKFFTCAVNSAGAAKCWGSNDDDKLGNPSVVGSTGVPVDVVGLGSDVLSVAAGWQHACGLTTAGAVKCWGAGSSNQLLNNYMGGSQVPVDIKGLSVPAVAITSGNTETCALTSSGAMLCWGSVECFTSDPQTIMWDGVTPIGAAGFASGVTALSIGSTHDCAVVAGGAMKCCGGNLFGELGTSSTKDSFVPSGVLGLSTGTVAVAAGFSSSCAVTSAGTVLCWGSNLHGQLGNSFSGDTLAPTEVKGISSAVSVTIGLNHACALTAKGGVKCWGWNFYGQLGNHSTADSFSPADVEGLESDVVSVSAGATHTCAVTTKGEVKCWGSNLFGELGNDSSTSSDVPVDVIGL